MEATIRTPLQQREENYRNLMALIRNFKSHRSKKGIKYDEYPNDCENKLINWATRQYPIINENKLVCFVGMLELAKEDSLIKVMADLITIGVITIDMNKLPNDIEFVCHPRDMTMLKILEDKERTN